MPTRLAPPRAANASEALRPWRPPRLAPCSASSRRSPRRSRGGTAGIRRPRPRRLLAGAPRCGRYIFCRCFRRRPRPSMQGRRSTAGRRRTSARERRDRNPAKAATQSTDRPELARSPRPRRCSLVSPRPTLTPTPTASRPSPRPEATHRSAAFHPNPRPTDFFALRPGGKPVSTTEASSHRCVETTDASTSLVGMRRGRRRRHRRGRWGESRGEVGGARRSGLVV